MDQGAVANILGRFLSEVFIIASPILLIAVITGLIVAIFQAVTSIQEQTLSFVPKLIAIFLVLFFAGPWMLRRLVEFTVYLFQQMGR